MKRDIFKGHLFLLIVILITMFSGLLDKFIPVFWFDLIHQPIFIALPAIIYVFIRKKNLSRTFRINPVSFKNILMLVLITLVMQPAVYLLASIAQVIFGNQLEYLFSDMTSQPFWYLLLTVAVAPAICEELVLRGVVMDAYRGQSLYTVIIMNGLLFGLFHMNINQFVYTFFMGVVLSLCVYYTNSIFAGMIIHFTNNFLSIFVLKYPESLYAKLEYWFFALETPLDIVKLIVLGFISFMLTFRLVNRMGYRNRRLYLNDASALSHEPILNWPLVILSGLFLIFSILLTLRVSSI